MAVLKGYIKSKSYSSQNTEAEQALEDLIRKVAKDMKIYNNTFVREVFDENGKIFLARVLVRHVTDIFMDEMIENLAKAMHKEGYKGLAIFYNESTEYLQAFNIIITENNARALDNYGYEKGNPIVYV